MEPLAEVLVWADYLAQRETFRPSELPSFSATTPPPPTSTNPPGGVRPSTSTTRSGSRSQVVAPPSPAPTNPLDGIKSSAARTRPAPRLKIAPPSPDPTPPSPTGPDDSSDEDSPGVYVAVPSSKRHRPASPKETRSSKKPKVAKAPKDAEFYRKQASTIVENDFSNLSVVEDELVSPEIAKLLPRVSPLLLPLLASDQPIILALFEVREGSVV